MPRRIVDLSLPIDDNMPSHKSFQAPVHIPHTTHEESAMMGFGTQEDPCSYATSSIGMIDHVGTHVDAFYHVDPRGQKIGEMPLEMFMGRAVCFDLTHIPDLGDIDVEDLEAAEEASGISVDGHIVLLNTGFHRRHYPRPEIMTRNPGLTAAATHWLADRGSKMHGVEGPSTDAPNNSLFESHRACRDRGISHYEWLVNLEELVGIGEFRFFGVPISLTHGTGGPVRAFAIIDD